MRPDDLPDPPISPDCEQQKHRACTHHLAAWDDRRDCPTNCTCRCHRQDGIAAADG